MATASYKTVRTFIGNGSQTTYNFAMDYLRKPFIVLVVDGVTKTFSTNYLINDQEMSILEAPPLGSTVVIKRVTTTDRLVVWEDASVLRASDMTIFELQLLHLQEEISDAVQTDAGEYADQAFVSAGIAKSEADRAEGIAEETADDVTALLEGYVQTISDAKDIVVPLVPIVQQAVIDAQQAVLSAQQAVTDAKSLGAVPVGMVVAFLTPVAPAGFLMMSGVNKVASFDPLLYPDLYTALGNINTLPDATNKFPEGAGDYIEGSAVKSWRLPAFGTNTTGEHAHTTSVSAYAPFGKTGITITASGIASGVSAQGDATSSAGDHVHTLSIPTENLDTYLAPDAFGVYWAIKAFGAVSNEGTAQVGVLVTSIDNRYTKSESDIKYTDKGDVGFTIIYPNGGTALSPATITINSRYVMPNPFPGYSVKCVVEIKVNEMWGSPSFIYALNGGYGAVASQLNTTGDIIVQTGSNALLGYAYDTGHPFGAVGIITTSTLSRVKIWKSGKVE